MTTRMAKLLVPALVLLAATAVAGEPDWFTRVKENGLAAACAVEVERFERGALPPSLHVGECFFELSRWEEGVAVFRRLAHSPDRNYAAAARARVGEGLYHLDRLEEARAVFTACREESPDAWLDGSIADWCGAWLTKLDGNLASPEAPAEESAGKDDLASVKAEIRQLTERLAELKALLEKLAEEK